MRLRKFGEPVRGSRGRQRREANDGYILNEDSPDRASTAETVGLVGEALITGATLFGQATTPPEPPNTGQLDDSQSSQHDRWRDSTNEASNQRSRPGTNQPK